jgi:hypothetical protein
LDGGDGSVHDLLHAEPAELGRGVARIAVDAVALGGPGRVREASLRTSDGSTASASAVSARPAWLPMSAAGTPCWPARRHRRSA